MSTRGISTGSMSSGDMSTGSRRSYAGHPHNMRTVVFAGGGTGGHLYPAISIASHLRAMHPDLEMRFFTTDRAIDQHILEPTGYDTMPQRLPHVSMKPWRWAGFVSAYRLAITRAVHTFKEQRPLAVVGTGGFGSFPCVRAAIKLGIPTALLNPDAVPGKANRVLIRFVDRVFAQWSTDRLTRAAGRRLAVLGCPVRPGFLDADKVNAESFGLSSHRKTLLVTGASQGARNINRSLLANIALLTEREDWQVLHLSGERQWSEVSEAYAAGVGRDHRARFVVLPFTHDMPAVMRMCDLVISRSGASTLAELTACGKPSILMPYPYHRDMHQLANARCLSEAPAGAAARIVIDRADDQENAEALRSALAELIDDTAGRKRMADAARATGKRDAARRIAESLCEMTGCQPVHVSLDRALASSGVGG